MSRVEQVREEQRRTKALLEAAANGSLDQLEQMLDTGLSVDHRDEMWQGPTALIAAAKSGQTPIVEWLLQRQASLDIAAADGTTALMASASGNHVAVIEALLAVGASIDTVDRDRATALLHAARSDAADAVEKLIGAGANVDAVDLSGRTPLGIAASQGYSRIVDLLLAAGAKMSDGKSGECREILVAAEHGDVETVEQLLNAGAPINARASTGATPLFLAASAHRQQLIEFLLRRGANPDIANEDSVTPLMAVVQDGNDAGALALIEGGAALELVDGTGNTALILATEHGNDSTAELLIDAGTDPNCTNERGTSALIAAIRLKRHSLVTRLIAAGADPDGIDGAAVTPLVEAAGVSTQGIVDALLRAGANPNLRPVGGDPPLFSAIRRYLDKKRNDVVALLLEHGADVDCLNQQSLTPLLAGIGDAPIDLLRLLIDRGANLQATTPSGNSALHIAVLRADHQVKTLVAAGVPPDSPDAEGVTPLLLALKNHNWNIASRLLMLGANPNIAADDGQTPLWVAVLERKEALVNELLKSGAATEQQISLGTSDTCGWLTMGQLGKSFTSLAKDVECTALRVTPLVAAICLRSADLTATLLAYGADPNFDDGSDIRALHIACHSQSKDLVMHLLRAGANVNARDAKGRTALHYITSADCLIELMLYDPDVDAQDRDGDTVLMRLARCGDVHLVDRLIGYGASKARTNAAGKTATELATDPAVSRLMVPDPTWQGGLRKWSAVTQFQRDSQKSQNYQCRLVSHSKKHTWYEFDIRLKNVFRSMSKLTLVGELESAPLARLVALAVTDWLDDAVQGENAQCAEHYTFSVYTPYQLSVSAIFESATNKRKRLVRMAQTLATSPIAVADEFEEGLEWLARNRPASLIRAWRTADKQLPRVVEHEKCNYILNRALVTNVLRSAGLNDRSFRQFEAESVSYVPVLLNEPEFGHRRIGTQRREFRLARLLLDCDIAHWTLTDAAINAIENVLSFPETFTIHDDMEFSEERASGVTLFSTSWDKEACLKSWRERENVNR